MIDIIKIAEDIAKEDRAEVLTLCHFEKALLTTRKVKEIFKNSLKSDYDILLNKIETACNNCKKVDSRIGDYKIRYSKIANFIKKQETTFKMTINNVQVKSFIVKLSFLLIINDFDDNIISELKSNNEKNDFFEYFSKDGKEKVSYLLINLITNFETDSLYTDNDDYYDDYNNEEADYDEDDDYEEDYEDDDEDDEDGFSGMFNPFAPRSKKIDLKKFYTDLTKKAKDYNKPFIGREDVMERAIQILCRMDKSNPVLVGEPGVGKTAITIGLAKMLIEDKVPNQLKGYKLYSVDLASMIAGTKYRGEFEERLTSLLKNFKKEGKAILFFDEIHTIIGAGNAEGAMDASNILKPYLTDGSLKFIGATTYKEYKRIEEDAAFMRRFQKIDVKEPTEEQAIEIIDGLREAYEAYHKVSYTKKSIEAAVKLTSKYVHDRFLPDKAIDMIDEAGAYVSIHRGENASVDEKDIQKMLTNLCNIPEKTFNNDEFKEIRILDKTLRLKIFGQDEAIDELVEAIKLNKSGLGDENKPIGTFLFIGPTGTGKTELSKQLASALDMNLIRFDMSEYSDKTAINKLIGSSAGYVGYEDGGLLVDAVRKTPNCVLLLDEIEKADPEVFKVFLQVMDYGTLKDNKGRMADFRNSIIIMTSNAGTRYNTNKLGFSTGEESKAVIDRNKIMDGVKETFAPEFRNRLTKIVQFNEITPELGKKIVNKELDDLNIKLLKKNISAKYSKACIDEIIKLGISPQYGAREIQRLIDSKIKKLFIDMIIDGKVPSTGKPKTLTIDVVDGQFVCKTTSPKTRTKKEPVLNIKTTTKDIKNK